MDRVRGADGDALDVLLLSEHLPTGSIVEILSIGIIVLQDTGENDSKIIAVPIDKRSRVLDIKNFEQLNSELFDVRNIIQLWFLGYKRSNAVQLIEWRDEIAANAEIDK